MKLKKILMRPLQVKRACNRDLHFQNILSLKSQIEQHWLTETAQTCLNWLSCLSSRWTLWLSAQSFKQNTFITSDTCPFIRPSLIESFSIFLESSQHTVKVKNHSIFLAFEKSMNHKFVNYKTKSCSPVLTLWLQMLRGDVEASNI